MARLKEFSTFRRYKIILSCIWNYGRGTCSAGMPVDWLQRAAILPSHMGETLKPTTDCVNAKHTRTPLFLATCPSALTQIAKHSAIASQVKKIVAFL